MAKPQIIESTVAGIPCLIRVDYFSAGCKAQLSGPPERCYEAEPAEMNWTVCDQRGREAPWLERKLSFDDKLRIEQEIEEFMGEPA